MSESFIDLNLGTELEFGGNYTTFGGSTYNYTTKRGITTKQTAVVVDALSEGPIYGLVEGASSVLLNGVPIMDPIMKVEYGALTSNDVSYVASTRTVTDNTGELFKNKNTAHGAFTIQISGALKTGTVSTTADSTVITSSSAFFTSDMAPGYLKGLGAAITIPGAGPDGAPAIGFIKSIESSTQAILATPVAKTVTNATVKLDLVGTISSITGNTAVLSGTGTLGINVSNVSSQISVPLITNVNTTPKWNFKDAGFAFRAGTRDQSHLMLPGATGSGTVFKSGATLNSTDYNAINYNGSPIFPSDYLTNGVGGDGKWSRIEQPSANRMTFTSDSMSIPNPNEVDKIKVNILFPSGLLAVKPKDGDERDGFCEFQILFEYSQTGNFDDTVTKTMFGLSDEALSTRAPINNDDNDNFGGYAGYHVNTGTVENKTKSKFIKTFEFDVAQFQPFTKYRIVIGKVTPTNGFGARRYWYNSTVIQSVENIITDKFTYPYTAYAATAFSAEDFQTPPKRGYEIRGLQVKVPTNYFARHELAEGQAASYTRNVSGNTVTNSSNYVDWDGTFRGDIKTYTDPLSPNYAPVWTDNPVWILLDVLTNDRYGLGKFVDPDDDFKYIDKYQLFQIAKYCDELVPDGKGGLEPRFTANLYLTKLQEAQKVIKDLLSIFRGLLIWFDGKFAPSINAYKSPVYTFTKGNIEGGVFKYQSSAKKFRANQIRVTWNNPDNLYQQDVEIVEDTQNIIETGKIISKDVSATGCTSSGQAHRYGKWFILTEKLEKEVVTFNTSLNAATLRPGDVIEVQDADINEVRYSGRVSSTGTRSTSIIPLDGEALTLDTSNYAYKLNLIYPSGGAYLAQETATIDSTTYNLGDLVLTDESGSSIDTLAKASNVKDDSGNLVQLHWSDQVRVETQSISSYTSGAVTVSSAFSAVPDAEVIWSITSIATATGVEQADVSPKEYIIIKTEEKEKNLITISAVEYADKKFELVDRGYTIEVVPDDLKSPIRTELVNPPRNLSLSISPTSLSSARLGHKRQDDILVSWEAPEDIKSKVTSTINGAVNNSTSIIIDNFDANIEAGMIAESSAITSIITVSSVNGKSITLSSAVTLANDATITFRKDAPDASITGYEVRVYGGHKRFISKTDFNYGYTLYNVGADQTSLTIEDVDPSIYTVHVRAVNSIQNYSRFITRKIRVTLRRIIQPSPTDKEGTIDKGGTLNQALNLSSSTLEIVNTSSSKSYTFEHTSGKVLENTSTTAQTYQQDFNGMGANAEAYLLLDGSEFLDSDNEVDATKTTDKLKAVQLVEDDTAVDAQGNKLNFEYWKTVGAANNGLTTISSATVSLDGAVVTGTNTSFTTNFEEGDPIIIGTGVNAFYAIVNIINSDTEVEIDRVSSKTYSGAAVAKLSFVPDLEQDQLLAKVTTDGSTNYTLAETYVKTSADVGPGGSTIVSGNTIFEGSISSSNFAGTGDGSAFSTAGTKINLNDGSIASEDFRIDSSGNAAFRGDISAASGTLSNSIQIGSGENVFKADSNGIYLGNETFANAEFRVTPAGALTATSADIKGDLETDNLIVTGNAGIHGQVRATSLTAGTVTIASINQEVWNEIDARTAPTQNGFYDNYDSDTTGTYYNGVATNFELLGPSSNGYLSNGQGISIRTSMVYGYGQQGNQTYTGDALKANFQFQYKALPSGNWTNFGSSYEGITSVYAIPGGFFYELDADPDASVSLSSGVYYQFRLRVTPSVTTNVWADSDGADTFAIEFAIQQSSTGTGSGTGTVTSVASGDGLSGGPITGSGTLAVDSTVVRTTGVQTIAGNKTFSNDLTVSGNLVVNGTSTTLNTAVINVEDKNIRLNYHASNDTSSTADGAGITIQDAVDASTDATILWDATNDEFDFSHPINTSGITSTGNVAASGTVSGQGLAVSSSGIGGLELGGTTGARIDLKKPNSDDYDLRISTEGTGGIIDTASGEVTIKRAGSTKLATTSSGINVIGNIDVGTNSSLKIYNDGTDSYIHNDAGDLYIESDESDKDIYFRINDGGSVKTMILMDGNLAVTKFQQQTRHADNTKANFGASNDLQIYHDTDNYIRSTGGDIYINQSVDDGSVYIQSDNSTGGITTYFQADGATGGAKLFHYGTVKLGTNANGVDIVGRANPTELYINGTPVIGSARALSNIAGITLDNNTNIEFPSLSNGNINLGRSGHITLYGDDSTHHSIASRNQEGNAADDITINTYGALYIDLDSNNNNTSGADFRIGRHSASSGTDSYLFHLSGETGDVGIGNLADAGDKLQVTGDVNVSGLLKVGVNDTEYANNYLRFKSAGAGYIDHNTTGQDINFRLSNSSNLDTTPLIVKTSGIKFAGTLTADDNQSILLGTGGDLRIKHDGSNSIISDEGQGNLELHATNLVFRNSADDSQYASFIDGGAATLRHAGNPKIATTSTGVDVTGKVQADTLIIDSNTNEGIKFNVTDSTGDTGFSGAIINYAVSGSDTLTGDRVHRGMFIDVDSSASGGNTDQEHRLYGIHVDTRATADSDLIYGGNFDVRPGHSSGQVSTARVISAVAYDQASGTGRTQNTIALYGSIQAQSTGTDTGSRNYYAGNLKTLITSSQAVDITTAYGLYSEVEIDQPTTAYSIDDVYGVRSLIDIDYTSNVTTTDAYLFYGSYAGSGSITNKFGMYIATNVKNYFRGNVAIGTTNNPSRNLHIVSDGTTTGAAYVYSNAIHTGTTNQSLLSVRSDNASATGTTLDVRNDGTGILFNVQQAGNIKLRVDNDGNIAMGHASPDYALDIRSADNIQLKLASTTTTANARMTYAINNVQKWNHGVDAASSEFTFYDVTTGTVPIRFEQGATQNTLVVDSQSKVGVGTNAPNGKLSVHQDSNGNNPHAGSTNLYLQDDNALAINNGGSIVFSGIYTSGGSHLGYGPYIKAYKTNATNNDYSFGLKLATRQNGVGAQVVGLNITHDQKVGIGANVTPTQTLEVAGNTLLSGDNRHIYFGGTNTFVGENSNSNKLELRGGGSNTASTVYIDNSGNVGIGVSAPSEKLHIKDTVFIDYPDGGGASLKIGRNDSSNYWEVNHAGADFRLYNTAGSGSDILLGLDASGSYQGNKVGIGTATPSATLEVATTGTTAIDVAHFSNSNGAVKVKVHLAANTGDGQITLLDGNNNEDVLISAVGNSYFNSGGNIGIGTTNPLTHLHIASSGDPTILLEDTDSSNQVKVRYKTTTTEWAAGLHGGVDKWKVSKNAGFGTNDYFTIDASGNVGIATDSPNNKLEVNGNIAVSTSSGNSGIKIITGNTAEGFIIFGDAQDNSMGVIAYDNSTNNLIFDSNNAEVARFISDGSLLIGKQTDDIDTVGARITQSGQMSAARQSNIALHLNRTTSYGYMQEFRYNGSAIGYIGVIQQGASGGDLFLSSGGASGIQIDSGANALKPMRASSVPPQSDTSIVMDLGTSNGGKFRDAYLSGKVQAATIESDGAIKRKLYTTSSSSTSDIYVNLVDITEYRTVKVLVQADKGSTYNATEIMLIHDGTTVYMTEYGRVGSTGGPSYDADINSGNLRLVISPGQSATVNYKINIIGVEV